MSASKTTAQAPADIRPERSTHRLILAGSIPLAAVTAAREHLEEQVDF